MGRRRGLEGREREKKWVTWQTDAAKTLLWRTECECLMQKIKKKLKISDLKRIQEDSLYLFINQNERTRILFLFLLPSWTYQFKHTFDFSLSHSCSFTLFRLILSLFLFLPSSQRLHPPPTHKIIKCDFFSSFLGKKTRFVYLFIYFFCSVFCVYACACSFFFVKTIYFEWAHILLLIRKKKENPFEKLKIKKIKKMKF